MAEEA